MCLPPTPIATERTNDELSERTIEMMSVPSLRIQGLDLCPRVRKDQICFVRFLKLLELRGSISPYP